MSSISSPTFSATMQANVRNTLTETSQIPAVLQGQSLSSTFTSGTIDSKFDRFWESRDRSLDSGGTASEEIDLYDLGSLDIGAGAGLDAVGQSFSNAELVGIQLKTDADSTGDLYVGGEASTAAWNSFFAVSDSASDTAQILLKPGSNLVVWSTNDPAWVITDTSNHLLQMKVTSGTVTYDIALAFRSA